MIADQETLRGWSAASASGQINAAIHPAGGQSLEAYIESGKQDAQKVIAYLKPEDTVLDYGCGNGRIMAFIPNKVIGVDIVKHEPWVITPDEFQGTVDVIFSLSVFIHNTQATGANILKWMYKHLNKGGKALVQIPIYDKHRDPGGWIDVGVWTEEQLRKAASDAGFKVVEVYTNPGEFSYSAVGKNHGKFQVLEK